MKKIFLAFMFLLAYSIAFAESEHYLADKIKGELEKFITRQLWNDYDIENINILNVKEHGFEEIDSMLENSNGRVELIKVHAKFKTVRNSNTSIVRNEKGEITGSLNQELYKNKELCEKGSKHLYLHCGVNEGYIFEGELELFVTRSHGGVAIICSHCTRLSTYRLAGYLILGGREKEGYVWFP